MAPPPRKPRPTHVQPVDEPAPPLDVDATPPEPAPDPRGEPRLEDIAPLWDHRETDGPAQWFGLDELDGTRVFRQTPAPGKKPAYERILVAYLDPTGTLEDIARQCGGGHYYVQAVRLGRGFAGYSLDIAGPPVASAVAPLVPPPTPGAAPPPAAPPIMETASGLAAIQGLSPEMQLLFAMQQQHSTQIREDSWRYNDRTLTLMQALVGRPPSSFQNEAMALYQETATRAAQEAAQLRATLERERHEAAQIRIRSATAEASRGQGPQAMLLEMLMSHGPDIVTLIKDALVAKNGAALGAGAAT
jgi:hypothetical protein